jgi:hypothetical protein
MLGISLELNTGKLEILPELHLGSNLNKEYSIVFYSPCVPDMHKITPNIHGVIAFSTWLSVK